MRLKHSNLGTRIRSKSAGILPAVMIAAFTIAAGPAIAQSSSQQSQIAQPGVGSPSDRGADDSRLTVGLGLALSPSYDGSDDYNISALPVFLGKVKGIDFQPRGPGLALDFIPDRRGAKIDFILGPVGRARFNRNDRIKDDVVASLGELDTAVELGIVAGIKFNSLFRRIDSLTAQVDVRWDVAGAHDGRVISPNLTYFTPLDQGTAISVSLNADHVDDSYNDYNFSISPAGTVASGLPTFSATGGWNNVGISALTLIDLDGNARNGGFSVILLGSYSRLLGDAKRSPVTSIRGDANQWFGALGLGYTF
ncbi:MipA/OmpV family protein [Parasphingorhabdus sp.]|uniref:MipA/OmpV family protein n=1 Tax=Parasphingorhabdus sp. TaxID=2709688 RepID=UPI003D29D07B